MAVVIVEEVRTVRAMRRVPTRFPADQWPGEPLVETGKVVECAGCRRTVDLCDMNGAWCIECDVRAFHPVHGWMWR